jgi:membrane fusion protein (multidrug efflux system)
MIRRSSLARSGAFWAAAAAMVFAGSCGRSGSVPPPRGPAEVAIVTLQAERIALTTELPGRTSPFLIAEVRPQVNGIIQKRLFDEGSDVRASELLYQIDPAPYQAAFDQASAALAVAEASLPTLRSRAERLKGLVEVHAVGEQDYDDASAALAQAEANATAARAAVESARINLSYTPVKAPISGRIGRSSVTVGALVTGYQPVPLATIQQLDPIYVDVTQASADLLRMRRRTASGELLQDDETMRKVKLLLEDGSQYPLEGSLEFRDITVDPTTGSVTLRMVFPNPDHVLLPGMFVRAVVEEGVSEQAILVPQQGVSRDLKGNPVAWIVNAANQVEQRPLLLDRAIGNRWLVTGGLAAGDRVIVEGLQKVRPGDMVRAVPFSAPSAGAPHPGTGQPAAESK